LERQTPEKTDLENLGPDQKNPFNRKKRNLKLLFVEPAKIFLVVFASVLIVSGIVKAGSLTPSDVPAASGYTLNDIYTRLTTNVSTTDGSHSFSPQGAPASTFYDLNDIYNAIPTIDPEKILADATYLGISGTYDVSNLSTAMVKEGVIFGISFTGSLLPDGGTASPSDVAEGKTFFGSNQSDWILQVGTLDTDATSSATSTWAYGDDDPTQVLTTAEAPGSYNAEDLVPANVRNGVQFGFNQTGTLMVSGNYAYGDDDPSHVLTIATAPGTFDVSNLANNLIKSGTTWEMILARLAL
jgi:hypothetical protein